MRPCVCSREDRARATLLGKRGKRGKRAGYFKR
jgi:hypothetical protein